MSFPTFTPGQRVALHPATNSWARGRRFADVVAQRPTGVVVVKFDDGKIGRITPENLEVVQ